MGLLQLEIHKTKEWQGLFFTFFFMLAHRYTTTKHDYAFEYSQSVCFLQARIARGFLQLVLICSI